MNPTQTEILQQTKRILEECFDQIRFARAADLARSRRYLEAEGLLSQNGRLPTEPKELDLLARIAAQQGQYSRAEELWKKALAKSPDREEFWEGLNALEELQRRKQPQRDFMPGVLFFLLLASATVLAVLIFSNFR